MRRTSYHHKRQQHNSGDDYFQTDMGKTCLNKNGLVQDVFKTSIDLSWAWSVITDPIQTTTTTRTTAAITAIIWKPSTRARTWRPWSMEPAASGSGWGSGAWERPWKQPWRGSRQGRGGWSPWWWWLVFSSQPPLCLWICLGNYIFTIVIADNLGLGL